MRHGVPFARPGQRVGLLGGSFDPPHAGHVHITLEALKRFDLDWVWWLVSPGNPLKQRGPASLARRMKACATLVDHPRVQISDFEARAGTRYTAETIARLQDRHHGVNFVWLMGADNLAQFHRWKDWHDIMARVPVGILPRPGDRIAARGGPAARIYRFAKIKGRQSRLLGQAVAPAWCMVNVPMIDQSSSAIRASGFWAGED